MIEYDAPFWWYIYVKVKRYFSVRIEEEKDDFFLVYPYMKYDKIWRRISITDTTQKMKFSIKDFFSKCDQIPMKLRFWSHSLKKSLIEHFIFCAVWRSSTLVSYLIRSIMLNSMTFDIYLSYVWQLSVNQEFRILCRRYQLNKFISFRKLQHCSKM